MVIERGPWKCLSSELKYQNPWISVREDRVERPDGKEGIYGVVAPKGAAIGIVPVSSTGEIYLVGQYRYAMEEYSWEIVEGGSEVGENYEQTAHRELLEEAGIRAGRLSPLGGEVHTSNCFCSERAYLFLAEELEFGEPNPDGTEVIEVKKVTLLEALAMLDEGIIKDSLSIIGLLRYWKLVSKS
ncbi:MAG: NUDIX hydrolase [Bdellovibrionales bacterium]|nr:NUDIX hydrolase [Bdellovibrionales bacterium]